MTASSEPHDEFPMEARRAIEKAVWMWGVRGDSSALLASKVIDALGEAGFTVNRHHAWEPSEPDVDEFRFMWTDEKDQWCLIQLEAGDYLPARKDGGPVIIEDDEANDLVIAAMLDAGVEVRRAGEARH